MRIVIVISFFINLIFDDQKNNSRYDVLFPDEYQDAVKFIKLNENALKLASLKYQHKLQLSTAIVFPELMRYSILKDIMEVSALELFYVEYGIKGADFSIGHFQMKPSFVEWLEQEISTNESLKKQYAEVLFLDLFEEKQKRKIRITRLKNIKWQIIYLHAFISVCDQHLKINLLLNQQDQLILYATAYNSGFNISVETLRRKSLLKRFPYGEHYDGNQYAYSDVSKFYFNNSR